MICGAKPAVSVHIARARPPHANNNGGVATRLAAAQQAGKKLFQGSDEHGRLSRNDGFQR